MDVYPLVQPNRTDATKQQHFVLRTIVRSFAMHENAEMFCESDMHEVENLGAGIGYPSSLSSQ